MASTNFAHLTHDANAGRYQRVEIPKYRQGDDIGQHLERLSTALEESEAKRATQATEIQRAFRTLSAGIGAVEQTVITAVTYGTNSVTIDTAQGFFLAIGATSRTVISGTNCT